MKKIKSNDWKKILNANWLLIGAMIINGILSLIAWSNTFRLENWLGYLSWAIFLFASWTPFYNSYIMGIFGIRARKKIKHENLQNSQIKTTFLNINNIILNTIFMLISNFWLILGFLYFLEINLIQAIFIIIISIFSIIYINYCFYFQSQIKKRKIKIKMIWEMEKNKCNCLYNKNLQLKDKKIIYE